MEYFFWACMLGALSAVSLPLGSWVGIRYSFRSSQISFLAAFGAGALFAALSVELIAPTTMAIAENSGEADRTAFYTLVGGCIAGGILYVLLDKAVNSKGGFLRKTSTVLNYYKKASDEKKREMITKVAEIPVFNEFPTENINDLLGIMTPVRFKKGDQIVKQGSPAEHLYILMEGEVEAILDNEPLDLASAKGLMISLIPVMTHSPNLGDAVAKTDVRALSISAEDFNRIRKDNEEFNKSCKKEAERRVHLGLKLSKEKEKKKVDWLSEAQRSVINDEGLPDSPFIKKASEEHHGSPFAIWLGILLDGIPESIVIGAGMLGILTKKIEITGDVSFMDVIPFTLIAGLFLSNFPEALSSSSNMLRAGLGKKKVLFLWFSLMVITALGAGAGYLLAGQLDHTFVIGMEGLAAGAMLTMIAAAMIPEAVIMGTGNLVGLSTLAGFLSAILFKLLE